MKPIELFFNLLAQRTTTELNRVQGHNQAIIYTIALLVIITIAFLFYVFFLLQRRITLPLALLETSAHNIEKGNHTHPIDITSKDEVGSLAKTFNSMAHSIEERTSRMRSIIETAVDGIVVINAEGNILEFSPASERIFGYRKDEVLGQDVATLIPEQYQNITNCLRTGKAAILGTQQETVGQRKNGELFSIELSVAEAIVAEEHFFTASIRDITQRKAVEQEIRHAKQKTEAANQELQAKQRELETIIDNLPAIFFIKDINGRHLMVNRLFEEAVGINKQQVLGHNDLKIFPTELAQAIYEKDQQVLADKVSATLEEVIPHADGTEHSYLMTKAPLLNEDGNPYALISMATDITLLKTLQRELIDAKESAESANRAKSAFLANISHELRTPLNAILGFSQLMSRDKSSSKQQQEHLSIINRSGEHLLSLINDVLDLSKIEAGKIKLVKESFDLNALIWSVAEMVQAQTNEKGLQFIIEPNTNFPCFISGDEAKLRQVLINLLGNAVKFTLKGTITLRIQIQPVENDANKAMLQLEIEDSGPGIAPDQLKSIFKPFIQATQTQSTTEGTGLGLAISKSLIELMGGEISVDSTLGEGSLFRIKLPATLTKSATINTIKAARPDVQKLEPNQTAWRILVAEDNHASRRLLVSLLSKVGFEVQEAENGKQAVETFQQWQPHFIWMDMQMPIVDGYSATAQIRAQAGDNIKIAAITANALNEQANEILNAGCDAIVTKPFETHEIFDCMAQLLGVRYVYAPSNSTRPDSSRASLTLNELSSLPIELLQPLNDAAFELDVRQAKWILTKIAAVAPKQADALHQMVDNFDFKTLKKLTSSAITEREELKVNA